MRSAISIDLKDDREIFLASIDVAMEKKFRSPALYAGFKRFVRAQGLLHRGNTVLVAVSGGIDSVVLLDLLAMLSAEWQLHLVILHVNHQLRGREAAADEKFAGSLAKHYSLRLFAARVETKKEAERRKISVQEAARDLRYSFFLVKKLELRADSLRRHTTLTTTPKQCF